MTDVPWYKCQYCIVLHRTNASIVLYYIVLNAGIVLYYMCIYGSTGI